MARHRVPRGRLHGFARRVAFDLAVLAGCVVGSALFAGAIWLACSMPGAPADSPDQVNLAPTSAVIHAP